MKTQQHEKDREGAASWGRRGAWVLALALASCVGRSAEDPSKLTSPAVDDDPEAPAVSAAVVVTTSERFQTLEGFGASVAWYLDRIVGDTDPELYQILFPELGLDILRFRNRFERSDPGDGDLKQEQEIFRRASEALGYAPKLLLSAWSPPAKLKASNREKCKSNPDCTLKKEDGKFVYDAYADWWLRSVQHYRSIGLAPDYVSIQNEPSFLPPDWEGCKFEPTETESYPGYGKALEAVHGRFAELGEQPKLLGPEVLGVHYDRVQNYLAGMDQALVYGVAHHLYEKGNDGVWDWRDPGPDSFIDELRGVRAATDKPLFQTEFNTDDDEGKDGGFETAWLMHHSLVEEGVVAWLYWDLIWVNNKGLVSMDSKKPKRRDHYYSMRHYARYTQPGYVRVAAVAESDGLLVSAYLAPDNTQLTVVLLNTTTKPIEATVEPQGFGASRSAAFLTAYRPGETRPWQNQGDLGASPRLRLPGRSVATVVLLP